MRRVVFQGGPHISSVNSPLTPFVSGPWSAHLSARTNMDSEDKRRDSEAHINKHFKRISFIPSIERPATNNNNNNKHAYLCGFNRG